MTKDKCWGAYCENDRETCSNFCSKHQPGYCDHNLRMDISCNKCGRDTNPILRNEDD